MKKRCRMVKTKQLISKSLLIALIFSGLLHGQKAIVTVAVADLVGQPLRSFYAHQREEKSYHELSWACYRSHFEACPRIHQLLFHEIVDIIGQQGNELQIRVPNVFYQTHTTHSPQNSYWVHKNNIIPLGQLQKNNIDLSKLPPIIDFQINNNELSYLNTISLIDPFYDPITQITFSAGTRFVKAKQQSENSLFHNVYRLNPKQMMVETIKIPKKIAHEYKQKQTKASYVTDFLSIIRQWAQKNDGIIPYVWGGGSFTQIHKNNNFNLKSMRIHGKLLYYYDRPHHANSVKTGFDCSSIIARAAQIVGIPYYFKNTHTLSQKLKPIAHNEKIAEGDLIWVTGHVMIVSNISKNCIIEAHAYDGGHGKIHEIELSKVFKGIKTFPDLYAAYKNQTSLVRIDSKNQIYNTYNQFKLLKFESVWKSS